LSDQEEAQEFTEDEKKIIHNKGLLFDRLLQSERFKDFLAVNYDFMKNPETMTLVVVEVPDDVVLERARKLLSEKLEKNTSQVRLATPQDMVDLVDLDKIENN